MNHLKSLTTNVLTCSVLVSGGFVGDAFADWRNDDLPEVIMEKSNKALAETALQALYFDADADVVDQYFAEDYIQHNPLGLNGRDFVKSVFIDNRPETYKAEADFMMVDGNYVFGYSRFTGFYDKPIIAADIYRIQDDKIVEHWDIIQQEVNPEETVSLNPMFPIEQDDEPVPEWQEKQNTVTVLDAITGLVAGNETAVDKYFAEDYIEHKSTEPDGTDALRNFATQTRPEDFNFEIGFVVADGPYVAMQTRTTGLDPTPVITFDIFKVSENLIVEHWAVIQNEVPVEETASGNPMFPIINASAVGLH